MAATGPRPDRAGGAALRRAIAELPLIVVGTILLGTGADILPTGQIVDAGPVELNLSRLLLIAGFAAFFYAEGLRPELLPIRLAIPVGLLLAAALATSIEWETGARFRFLVEGIALFVLACAVVRSARQRAVALTVVALAAVALSALTGISQVTQDRATGFYRDGCRPVTAAPPGIPPGTVTRARGTFENPNLLAAHVLLLAPLAAAAAAAGAGRRRGDSGRGGAAAADPAATGDAPSSLGEPAGGAQLAVAGGLVVGLAYLGLVLTYSRAGVLIAILGAGVAVAASRAPRRGYLAAVGVAVAIGASFLFATCGSEGAAGFGRIEEWRETMGIVGDNPVLGVGLGRVGGELRARDPRATTAHSHNLFLNWWAEAGPAALVAWLWLFGVLLWWSLRAALRGDALARAALVALLGFAGFSMVDHPANVDRIALALWCVAGIAAGLAPARRTTPAPSPRTSPLRNPADA